MITGNKGEWSEIYAHLRLLADGRIFAADEQLNRIGDMFFPIIKIIREEVKGTRYEYFPTGKDGKVKIYHNEEEIASIPADIFDRESRHLITEIERKEKTFEVEQTESFIRGIYMTKLKAPSANKADINVQIRDVNTGYEKIVGFSIKSELGSPPTLLNAGRTTNFIYVVDGLDPSYIEQINAIDTRTKIIDRIKAIFDNGGRFSFETMENSIFQNNLVMIDSQMPAVVAEMLIGYYAKSVSHCSALANYASEVNPLSCSADFYKHKIKDLLCAVALGMKPATPWDGTDEATGGYVVVKTNGEVLAFHLFNRDAFRNYLFNNTKFDKAGTSKHGFGKLYQDGDKIKFNMNLQIRFT